MSYHLDQEKGKKAQIEMPPLKEEVAIAVQQPEIAKTYEIHPELQNTQPFEAQEIEQPDEQVQEQPEVQEEPKPQQESVQAKNFRQIKELKERAEWERDELRRRLESYETSKQQVKPQEIEEQDININPDDLVEGKHLNKYDKKIRKLQDDLRIYQQQTQLAATETRLKNQYPDFDKVVSKDNIEQLKANYPELAETLNASSTDLYSKAVSAYTLIKKLGISPDDVYQQDREKAIKNAAKPRPLASVSPQQGESPLSKANAFANGLTDELKDQLRKEMYAAMKNK